MSARDVNRRLYGFDGNAALSIQQPVAPFPSQREREQQREELRRQARQEALARLYARRAVALFVLACVLMVGILFLQTRIQQNNIELNQLKNTLNSLENENQSLQVKIGYADDLNEARVYAAGQRDMGAAEPWQVVTVRMEDVR